MSRQDQQVAEGALAVQAAGAVNISVGMTAEQMTEIMVGLAKQLAIYQAGAERLAEARLSEFRREILEEFQKPGRANAEAFKDPDFQYLLNRAQHAYARSGDRDIGQALVQMIAERSRCDQRTRMSLALNQAIDTAAVLTANEFAELSLYFVVVRTRNHSVVNMETFKKYFYQHITPLLDAISLEESSYSYLVAQQCAVINPILDFGLEGAFLEKYGGIFCDGFTIDELKLQLNDDAMLALAKECTIPCLNDQAKIQLNAINATDAKDLLIKKGLSAEASEKVCNLYRSKMWPADALVKKLEPILPEFGKLAKLWRETPLHQMTLTALGIAIGHANINRIVPDFGGKLSIWIK